MELKLEPPFLFTNVFHWLFLCYVLLTDMATAFNVGFSEKCLNELQGGEIAHLPVFLELGPWEFLAGALVIESAPKFDETGFVGLDFLAICQAMTSWRVKSNFTAMLHPQARAKKTFENGQYGPKNSCFETKWQIFLTFFGGFCGSTHDRQC